MSIQILDVYSDNRVDWEQEVATGTDGVLIKLGQGSYSQYADKKCNFIERAEAVGLPWGTFWQTDARYSPEKAKAAVKANFDTFGFGSMGLWMACELPFYPLPDYLYWKMPYSNYRHYESLWRGVEKYTGMYPGIYSSISKWTLIFGSYHNPDPKKAPRSLQEEIAAKSRLWAAQYKVKQPDPFGAWDGNWSMWQYTENPDYSVVKDEAWFTSLVNAKPEVPPVVPPIGGGEVPAVWKISEQSDSRIVLERK